MQLKEALYYQQADDSVRCLLCPHQCLIHDGKAGICRVRRNVKGKLYTEIYGKLSSINFDPIEKKPLYHFYPGSIILSVGTIGCNMHCRCCQNWQISQSAVEDFPFRNHYEIEDIVSIAKSRERNTGIAFTYNEPGIWIEYVLDVARQIQAAGLKNVMVSNGFINEKPLDALLPFIDAFNIDLKAFSDSFYQKITGARLEPVLKALKKIARSGKHLEITNLIIPGLNDNEEEFTSMAKWIAGELGQETVLHLSRYHPMFRMEIESTPPAVMERLAETASRFLSYVYVGNIEIREYRDTKCPNCGTVLIKRSGYHIEIRALDEQGACLRCHKKVFTVS